MQYFIFINLLIVRKKFVELENLIFIFNFDLMVIFGF